MKDAKKIEATNCVCACCGGGTGCGEKHDAWVAANRRQVRLCDDARAFLARLSATCAQAQQVSPHYYGPWLRREA